MHQAVQFGMLIYDGVSPAAPINHRVGANLHVVPDLCPKSLFDQVCASVRSQTKCTSVKTLVKVRTQPELLMGHIKQQGESR